MRRLSTACVNRIEMRVTVAVDEPTERVYTVSQKNVQNCFCQNFVKFLPILIIFWQKDGKGAKIMRGVLIFQLI